MDEAGAERLHHASEFGDGWQKREADRTIWHRRRPDGVHSMNLKETVRRPGLMSAALPRQLPVCLLKTTINATTTVTHMQSITY